jgi:GNAT superfamily N-acetyltransferase
LDRYRDVTAHISAVGDASDAHRGLLGFFPTSVFDEFARRDELFVLISEGRSGPEYAGHLMFDRRFPRTTIRQIYVTPECRGKKGARLLIDHLVGILTREGFTSIYARVGEDMSEANERWRSLGFRVQRTEPGGATTGRTIVVRVRELESPQLFPTRAIDQSDPLGVAKAPSVELPLFLVDLNVLFDLSPRRKRHEEAVTLFKAERADFCKLAISEELIVELERTAAPGRPDSMMDLARTFARFPISKVTKEDVLFREIHQLVFPQKNVSELTRNDTSDLRHLITAVENGLAGFITNDHACLTAAEGLKARFGIQVFSPRSFVPNEPAGLINTSFETSEAHLTLTPAEPLDYKEIRALLSRLRITPAELASGWLPPDSGSPISSSCAVRNGTDLLAYFTWSNIKQGNAIAIRAAVDDTKAFSLEAARGVIMHCMNLLVDGPTILRIKVPADQILIREVALGMGFCSSSVSRELTKLALGLVATRGTWSHCRSALAALSGLRMDGNLPSYRGMDQQISYVTKNDESGYEPLERIETLLAPMLFCLPGRPAVITPIQHGFAKLLLSHSPQKSLLPAPSSSLFQERHYLGGSHVFNRIKRGTLMLFYETGHPRSRGELVAIARVRRVYLKEVSELGAADLYQSVLTPDTLPQIGKSSVKTVIVFDNAFPLIAPIPLDRLQDLGCGRATDLITTHAISDTQLQAILAEGFKT